MLRLSSDITLGDFNFDFVNNIEIVSSWENLTDTATITIPKKLRMLKDGVSQNIITAGEGALWKRGDAVSLRLGYNDKNDLRFDGVITKIKPKFPLEFTCEDKMWTLKQTTIKKFSSPSITIPELLRQIIPAGISYEAEDINLGKFIIEQATVAEVLEFIKKTFGLSAYFQSGKLYVGLAYKLSSIADFVLTDLKKFEFQKSIIESEGLDYIREEDLNLRVTAILIKSDYTRKEITVGDSLGEQRTLHFYNISEADVKTLANEALTKLKYTGFRGSFTTFLKPYVKHGDAVKIVDKYLPDRNGVYLVKKVVTTFGVNGGRQEITLDRKIA